jgi:hypothetical protein
MPLKRKLALIRSTLKQRSLIGRPKVRRPFATTLINRLAFQKIASSLDLQWLWVRDYYDPSFTAR